MATRAQGLAVEAAYVGSTITHVGIPDTNLNQLTTDQLALGAALLRRVPLTAGKILEVRGEAFNLANTPPLGAPNGVFGSAAFGTITSAGDPRVLQIGLKFRF